MSKQTNLLNVVKIELRSVLLSSPVEITLRRLETDYRKYAGYPIPFRDIGYGTLEDFIADIPDVVSCRRHKDQLMVTGVPDLKTKHVARLVSLQKKPPHRKENYASSGTSRSFGEPPKPSSQSHHSLIIMRGKVKELLFAYTSGLKVSQFQEAFAKRFGQYINFSGIGYQSDMELLGSMPDILDLVPIEGTDDIMIVSKCANTCNHISRVAAGADSDTFYDCSDSPVNSQLQAEIQQVLTLHPDGIKSSKFPAEFQKIIGKELPLKTLGYTTILDLMASIPSVVRWERPSAGDWILFDARTSTKSVTPSGQDACLPVANDWKHCKEAIVHIIGERPDGFMLADLEQEFTNLTRCRLDACALGFKTLVNLILKISSVDMKYQGQGQVMLFLKAVPEPEPEPVNVEPVTAIHINFGIPNDAVVPGEQYTLQELPPLQDDNAANSYFVVRVSEVDTPSRLYVQLDSQHNSLENLMNELQEYSRLAMEAYNIPVDLLCVGLVCIGRYMERTCADWHRCLITGFRDLFVEVFYVDYGTTACVSAKNLRLMRRQYLLLPAQAIRARLANVAPANGSSWNKQVKKCILSLVENKRLVGKLNDVDVDTATQEKVASVVLCDTSGEDDVYISDVLVVKHLAVLVDDQLLKEQAEIDAANTAAAAAALQDYAAMNSVPAVVIKFVQLTDDYSVHLLTIEDKVYIACAEISALLWTEDILRSELRLRGCTSMAKLILTIEDHKDILEALAGASIPGTIVDGRPKDIVVVFHLSSVLDILEIFHHPSDELKTAIKRLLGYAEAVQPTAMTSDPVTSNSVTSDPVTSNSVSASSTSSRKDHLCALWESLDAERMSVLRLIQTSRSADETRRHAKTAEFIESQMKSLQQQIEVLSVSDEQQQQQQQQQQHSNSPQTVNTRHSRTTAGVAKVEPSVLSRGRGRGRAPASHSSNNNVATIIGLQRTTPQLDTRNDSSVGAQHTTSQLAAHGTADLPVANTLGINAGIHSNSGAAGLLVTGNPATMMQGNSMPGMFAMGVASNGVQMFNLLSQLALTSAAVENQLLSGALTGASMNPPMVPLNHAHGALSGAAINPGLGPLSGALPAVPLNPLTSGLGAAGSVSQFNSLLLGNGLLSPTSVQSAAAFSSPFYGGSLLGTETLNWLSQQSAGNTDLSKQNGNTAAHCTQYGQR